MIVRHSKFASNPFGDGGSKRSAQIEELLKSDSLKYENNDFLLPKGLSKFQLLKLSIRAIKFIRKNIGWKAYPSLKARINAIKYFALRIPVILDKYNGKNICFVWESTVSGNYGYPYLMKAAEAKVIAVPHNLESVVPTQKDSQTGVIAPKWFYNEIERLKKCDAVFAISKEETWILRLFGVNAHYLPYYPPQEALDYLLKIREKRAARADNTEKRFLLLGSATNVPTQNGMQSLIDAVSSNKRQFSVAVAGYGTDSLHIADNGDVKFLGPLSSEQLETALIETDAVLIYQPPTSGALTRITEMLVTGVPVFVNFNAARDCHNVEDVNVYESFDDLFAKLESFDPHQAKMPTHQVKYDKIFVDTVKDFCATNDRYVD